MPSSTSNSAVSPITHPPVRIHPAAYSTPEAIAQSVPIVVIVFGATPRRTSASATGSMRRRYPERSQSGSSFIARA